MSEGDFIESWMEMTDGVNSPDMFRLWSGISLVAGACERRVWARAAKAQTFPNLYVLLTAAPGVGKQIISLAKLMWKSVKEPNGGPPAFRIAPTQMTKASLVDSIAKASQFKMVKGANVKYHSLLVAAEEFQVLLPHYDEEYIGTLNEIFNNPDAPYEEMRRTGTVKEISIENPQLNILAGVQPSYFVSTFPEHAWTTGFARRIIMVYAAEGKFQELFQVEAEEIVDGGLWVNLQSKLSRISALYGQASWEPEAADKLAKWHRSKGPPIPTHSKLIHYNNSRTMFAIKLSIVSAVSRSQALVITEYDVKRALTWLTGAEALMPDVFREMAGKSDAAVIDEMHFMLVNYQDKFKKAAGTDIIWDFLRQRVPSDKIEKIMMTAEKSKIIFHPGDAPDLWQAKAMRNPRGVE